jgi:tRNA(adenine34) deaminase
MDEDNDVRWMRCALEAAQQAESIDEVPVGACIVSAAGRLISKSGNRTRADCDPCAHAEILVLREASRILGNFRLGDSTIYCTIEPCAMCAGAMVQARVKRLVYGARDERAGAVDTQFHICASSSLNHQIEVKSGVLEDECRTLMQKFFRERRGQDAGC